MFCKAFIEAYVNILLHTYLITHTNSSGCDKVAIVDLNQKDAQTSANALVEDYGILILFGWEQSTLIQYS